MPDRTEVYAVIDGERYYQDQEAAKESRTDMNPVLSLGDHILAMEHLLQEARTRWYSGSPPHNDTLERIRKVTAMGVKCMEQYGAPPRIY